MIPGVDAGVDVPTRFLRFGIRIVKDNGPGIPEFKNMTPMTHNRSTETSTNTPQAEKKSFRAGDMAVCDQFATDVPHIIMAKKLHLSTGRHSGYRAPGVEQTIPRDFVEHGLQMAGPVAIKSQSST
ncbi:hypothetical protein CaCOL14_003629 [Colletotrichum acutatum]